MNKTHWVQNAVLGLGLVMVATMASADVVNNAGAKQLQQEAVTLLQTSQITEQNSQAFLKRNRFDIADMAWGRNGQVIHGPYYVPNGEEEGENVPYVFAYNQGKNVVGIGGWLPAPLLTRLQALPTVKCQRIPKEQAMWVCAHRSATTQTTATFGRDLAYLAAHSN